MAQNQGNRNQMMRQPMAIERYRQIDFNGIQGYPNPISNDLRNAIPKFLGNGTESAERHIINLKNVIEDFEEDHEDVFMKLFVQSLIEDAVEWYKSLPDRSISGWCNFADQFIEQFGDHTDTSFASHELTSIKKNSNESVLEFNKRFNKVLNRIPRETRPVDSFLIDFYLSAFDGKTHYEIRSQRPSSLPQAFKIAMTIENDRKAAGRINKRDDPKLYNPKNPRKDD
jgi:hypothetical protein